MPGPFNILLRLQRLLEVSLIHGEKIAVLFFLGSESEIVCFTIKTSSRASFALDQVGELEFLLCQLRARSVGLFVEMEGY